MVTRATRRLGTAHLPLRGGRRGTGRGRGGAGGGERKSPGKKRRPRAPGPSTGGRPERARWGTRALPALAGLVRSVFAALSTRRARRRYYCFVLRAERALESRLAKRGDARCEVADRLITAKPWRGGPSPPTTTHTPSPCVDATPEKARPVYGAYPSPCGLRKPTQAARARDLATISRNDYEIPPREIKRAILICIAINSLASFRLCNAAAYGAAAIYIRQFHRPRRPFAEGTAPPPALARSRDERDEAQHRLPLSLSLSLSLPPSIHETLPRRAQSIIIIIIIITTTTTTTVPRKRDALTSRGATRSVTRGICDSARRVCVIDPAASPAARHIRLLRHRAVLFREIIFAPRAPLPPPARPPALERQARPRLRPGPPSREPLSISRARGPVYFSAVHVSDIRQTACTAII